MRTAEEQEEMMREQVNSKILWGASDQEVLDWLEEKHNIHGLDADRLLSEAYRRKSAAVRQKAIINLVFAGPGILLSGIYFYVYDFKGLFSGGRVTIMAGIIGFISLAAFFRNLARLLSGDIPGSVD